jgi:hypothetical protein
MKAALKSSIGSYVLIFLGIYSLENAQTDGRLPPGITTGTSGE